MNFSSTPLFEPLASRYHWEKVGICHHHGVAFPLSALKSRKSCGIGDFLDLVQFIQWLPTTGFDLIQLLPLNDSGEEASPYSALSSKALNPVYIACDFIPQEELTILHSFNDLPRIPYLEVVREKIRVLKKYFRQHSDCVKDPKFIEFVEKEKNWLKPYAQFRALKHNFQEKPWWEWPEQIKSYPPSIDIVLKAGVDQLELFFSWLQFIAFSQLEKAHAEAEKSRVLLVGDIPILLNKDSADVWQYPELFDLTQMAGAPPDVYAKEGQAWGFPTFNWKMHEKTGHEKTDFEWWKSRLQIAERFFDLYRIDHVVGFFRIWAIAAGKSAKEGKFIPEDPSTWYQHGTKLLKMMLKATTMLPIAEDLGVIPDCARQSLFDLGIPGLKVLRWERAWNSDAHFLNPQYFSPESCTTVSTHDSETLAQWWENDKSASRKLCSEWNLKFSDKLEEENRLALLGASHTSGSLFHVNLFQEYLAFFPDISWRDQNLDRINIPGVVHAHNWTFRLKSPLEELTQHKGLLNIMKKLSSI